MRRIERPSNSRPRWRADRQPRRSKTGCGRTWSYFHESGRYRVDFYLAIGELPFVAVLNRSGRGGEIIGRFDSLDAAQVACERHKGSNGRPRVNSNGDPIVKRRRAR